MGPSCGELARVEIRTKQSEARPRVSRGLFVGVGDEEMIEITTEKLPIHIWAEPEDLAGYDSAIAQARNLANHPLARERICLMPDFHVGYGMPIGGVLATEGGVVPNAVGV